MNQVNSLRWKEFTIREATSADIDIVLHHRRSMFYDMGYHDDAMLSAMLSTSRPFFAERLGDGRFHAWLVENGDHDVIAGGGLLILDYPSSARDPLPRRALIVNVYTEAAYRRKGIARQVMLTMIDWCRNQGFGSVVLHASDDGRPLYEHLGFTQTNEMRLLLGQSKPSGA